LRAGTELANTAMQNSDLSIHLSFKFVDFDYQFHTSWIDQELTFFKADPKVAALRAQHASDIVILLGDHSFSYPGIAELFPNQFTPYGIVDIPFLLSKRYTFVHELGHILGADHARAELGCGDADKYFCGHGFCFFGSSSGKKLYTLHAFDNDNNGFSRILHFSNPNVNYDNKPTGDNSNDNSSEMNLDACTVQNYQTPAPPVNWKVAISGTTSYCPDDYIIESANVTPGTNEGFAPFTYAWTYSTSSIIDWNSVPTPVINSTGVDYNFSAPSTAQSDFWVHLKVKSADNLVLYKSVHISLYSPISLCKDKPTNGRSAPIDKSKIEETLRVQFVPNPAEDYMQIKDIPSSCKQIRVFSVTGQLIENINPKGNTKIDLDLNQYSAGLYQIELVYQNFTTFHKI
jgi:hypothetical protein